MPVSRGGACAAFSLAPFFVEVLSMEKECLDAKKEALRSYESIIQAHLDARFSMGNALKQINDLELYTPAYSNFPDYCIGRWGLNFSIARNLMEFAENLSQFLPWYHDDDHYIKEPEK